MKNHLEKWLQTGRLQPIVEATHNGIDIYIRYHKGFKMYQYFFAYGRSGYNSAFAYQDADSAILAAKAKIESWQAKKGLQVTI